MTAPAKVKKKTALTGIKPSGTPHVGNYLGAIKPALSLVEDYQPYYFIADYHALTTIRDKKTLKRYTHEVAASWLALGLDPEEVVFYKQSDIPEIFELTWVLACFTGKGLLNRAHAYKASVDANLEAEREPDDGVNVGLYNYPVLMAADILMFHTQVVPVGQDQRQHIEITRDIANSFNHTYGDVLTVPDAHIVEDVATVPGLDGRKMSKSYGNILEIFAAPKQLRKQVMRIVTDSSRPEDPKDPDADNVYNIFKYFADPVRLQEVRKQYLEGGLAYGDMKQELFEVLDAAFEEPRARYNELMANPKEIDAILQRGGEKARPYATRLLGKIRKKIGLA